MSGTSYSMAGVGGSCRSVDSLQMTRISLKPPSILDRQHCSDN